MNVLDSISGGSTSARGEALVGSWAELAQDFALLGTVVTVTRNEVAALFTRGAYPDLSLPPERDWAVNPAQLLSLDFNFWQTARAAAIAEKRNARCCVEVFDDRGRNFHSLLLGAQSDLCSYEKLVAFYHAELPGDARETSTRLAPWQSTFRNRLQALRKATGPDRQRIRPDALPKMILAAQKAGVKVTAGAWTDGAIQRQPCLITETGRKGDTLWLRDETMAAVVSMNGVAEVWRASGVCSCCQKDRWVLECYDRHDRLVFTLQSTEEKQEEQWRTLFPA